MSTQTGALVAPASPADAEIRYHWLISIQTEDNQIITQDGVIGVVPGVHTRMQSYMTVRRLVREKYQTDGAVLFFSLDPDQL